MQINIFKKKKNFKKSNTRINRKFYWNLILGIVLLLVLGSFVFSFYLFNQVNQEFISSSENTTGRVGQENKDKIEKVLQYFADRDKKSTQIISSPAPVIDPSL
jgi:uncharacterized membrane protein YhaH (DUF805 family)